MSLKDLKNRNVVLYLLNKSKDKTIERLKLIKLIWLADRWHLNQYGRLITKSKYVAMPHGPVASDVYDLITQNESSIKTIGYNQIALEDADVKYLSKTDMDILDKVWSMALDASSFNLRDFSHKFPEWRRFENYLQDKSMPNSYEIVMNDFFEENEFLNLVSPEVREINKQEYLANQSLLSSLNS